MTPAEALAACASYQQLHPRLYSLALAIQHHEGYYPGSRSFRNNNPGNLRSSPLADRIDHGFAVFGDYYSGLAALLRDLWGKCTGHSTTGLTGDSELRQLVAVYAPSVENDVGAYLYALASVGAPGEKLRTFL